jgi:hypothetical protein
MRKCRDRKDFPVSGYLDTGDRAALRWNLEASQPGGFPDLDQTDGRSDHGFHQTSSCMKATSLMILLAFVFNNCQNSSSTRNRTANLPVRIPVASRPEIKDSVTAKERSKLYTQVVSEICECLKSSRSENPITDGQCEYTILRKRQSELLKAGFDINIGEDRGRLNGELSRLIAPDCIKTIDTKFNMALGREPISARGMILSRRPKPDSFHWIYTFKEEKTGRILELEYDGEDLNIDSSYAQQIEYQPGNKGGLGTIVGATTARVQVVSETVNQAPMRQ